MRITTQTFYNNALQGIQKQRSKVNQFTGEIASGKSVSKPSQGPVAFSSAQRTQANKQALSQYTSDNSNIKNNLNLASSTLQNSLGVLSHVKSIALQALNGSTSNSNRAALAKQVHSAKQQLLSLANTQSNGTYLFAGSSGGHKPFIQNAAGQIHYTGDGGHGSTHISPNRQVTSILSGTVFSNIPQGNGYGTLSAASSNTGNANISLSGVTNQSAATAFRRNGTPYTIKIAKSNSSPTGLQYKVQQSGSTVASGNFKKGMSIHVGGNSLQFNGSPAAGDQFTLNPSRQQSIFTTINHLEQTISQPIGSGAQRAKASQNINSVISNLNQARTKMLSQQATIGVSMRAINNANNANATQKSHDKQAIASKTNANIPQVMSALNQHQHALTDAMKAFGTVSKLSLFKYV